MEVDGFVDDDVDTITDDENDDDKANVATAVVDDDDYFVAAAAAVATPVDDDDYFEAPAAAVDDPSSVRNWSFYECVVRGSVDGVERHLAEDPSLVDKPFRLSAISDPTSASSSSASSSCVCWQYFEVGFQIDHLAGFYPGTLSWHSRVYPPIDGGVDGGVDGSSTSASASADDERMEEEEEEEEGDEDDSRRFSSRPTSSSSDRIHSRLRHFFLSLKKKPLPGLDTLRVCRCRKEDSLRLLLDSASRCRDSAELESLTDDSKTMNKLAVTYPLHVAAMFGWRRVLETLLKRGADTATKTKACGLQAIHLSVMYRRRSCLQALIDAGADVNSYAFYTSPNCPKDHIPFEWRILPISQAIELLLDSNNRGVVVRHRFEPRKRSYEELIEWHNLVQCSEDAEMVEAILRAPSGCLVNKIDGPPEEFTYPLLRAIPGDTALVERLLVAGADCNVVGWGEDSSLSMALPEQDLELVKMLLFYGADPNHRGDNEDTVLHFLAQATISSEDDVYYEMMKYFLDHGADPNLANGYGETPLMDAINVFQFHGVESVACNLLLRHPGVDVTLGRRDDFYTPLHSAAWNNLNGVVKTVLEKGADPCALTLDKNSPLGIAAFRRNREAVYLLAPLNRHVIDNADKDGDRAIHYAAYQGDVDMVNCLLDNGADPDVANDHDVTPIWYTCYKGHMATLIQLLRFQTYNLNKPSRGTEQMENGYNFVNYFYQKPRTPLYAACDQGNFEVAQLLLDRGYPIHEEQEWILLSPPQKLLENDDYRRYLVTVSSRPPTLRSRVMTWFRATFAGDLPRVAGDLPLPTRLKRQLIHRDLPGQGKNYVVQNYDDMCIARFKTTTTTTATPG